MCHFIRLASEPSEFFFVSGHFNLFSFSLLLLFFLVATTALVLRLHFISFTCHDDWSLHRLQRRRHFFHRETEASEWYSLYYQMAWHFFHGTPSSTSCDLYFFARDLLICNTCLLFSILFYSFLLVIDGQSPAHTLARETHTLTRGRSNLYASFPPVSCVSFAPRVYAIFTGLKSRKQESLFATLRSHFSTFSFFCERYCVLFSVSPFIYSNTISFSLSLTLDPLRHMHRHVHSIQWFQVEYQTAYPLRFMFFRPSKLFHLIHWIKSRRSIGIQHAYYTEGSLLLWSRNHWANANGFIIDINREVNKHTNTHPVNRVDWVCSLWEDTIRLHLSSCISFVCLDRFVIVHHWESLKLLMKRSSPIGRMRHFTSKSSIDHTTYLQLLLTIIFTLNRMDHTMVAISTCILQSHSSTGGIIFLPHTREPFNVWASTS